MKLEGQFAKTTQSFCLDKFLQHFLEIQDCVRGINRSSVFQRIVEFQEKSQSRGFEQAKRSILKTTTSCQELA